VRGAGDENRKRAENLYERAGPETGPELDMKGKEKSQKGAHAQDIRMCEGVLAGPRRGK
jgi:hypothetical protein